MIVGLDSQLISFIWLITIISQDASSFAAHMHELHKEISDRIEHDNTNYKLRADIKKKFKNFNVGDFVMVRIHPERFSRGTVKKLNVCSVGPFKILKKFNDNAYVIYLFKDFGISSTFNAEDLVDYKVFDFNPCNLLVDVLFLEFIF